MIELKPCPFCGGEATFRTRTSSLSSWSTGLMFEVGCEKCDIYAQKRGYLEVRIFTNGNLDIKDERQMIADIWNTRKES